MRLEANDGAVLEVTEQQAAFSKLLSSMLEKDDGEEQQDDTLIPLRNVTGEQLRTIGTFLELMAAAPMRSIVMPLPVSAETLADLAPEPYIALVCDLTKKQLGQLLMAADYVQADALVHLCAAQMALHVRTMSEGEIRDFFGITKTESQ